jgi:hypothetical protein
VHVSESKSGNRKVFLLLAIFVMLSGFLFFGRPQTSRAIEAVPPMPPQETIQQIEARGGTVPAFDGKAFSDAVNKTNATNAALYKSGAIKEPVTYDNSSVHPVAYVTSDSCSVIKNPITCPMVGILKLLGYLLSAAAALFTITTDPAMLRTFLDAEHVYFVWTLIRDILNVAFIMVLLFSAFATIFQVSKYSFKNNLFNIVLMALLVNFSFPITRFIIDISNVLMYTLINELGPMATTSSLSGFADGAGIAKLLSLNASGSISSLLAAIVFTFVFTVTIVALALMFMVRMIMLAIIIMLSPVAFTGTIIFGIDGGYAKKWWKDLLDNAFFGPIMIFFLLIATRIMQATVTLEGSLRKAATDNALNGMQETVMTMAMFSMPIAALWLGMGYAKKHGGAGADAIMGQAQKFTKGAGQKFSGYSFAKRNYDKYAAERKKRAEEVAKKQGGLGKDFGKWANNAQDAFLSVVPFAATNAAKRLKDRKETANKEDIEKGAKDLIDGGATTGSLAHTVNTAFSTTGHSKDDKVKHAQAATAYLRQDADERKSHIEDTLRNAASVNGSDVGHIFASAAAGLRPGASAARTAFNNVRASADRIAAGHGPGGVGTPVDEKDVRRVAAFVSSQMKKKVEDGVSA